MAETAQLLAGVDAPAVPEKGKQNEFEPSDDDAAEVVDVKPEHHPAIIQWLRESTASVPEITEGLEESIVSWFLQSGYLLPLVVNVCSEPCDDLTSAIRVLVQQGCLQPPTVEYLRHACEDAPPPDLVWRILEDIFGFATLQRSVSVPLAKTQGTDRPVVFDQATLSTIFRSLGLPPLPAAREIRRGHLTDNSYRNGQFFMDLYCVLEGIESARVSTPSSAARAIQTVKKALKLFRDKNFIDESFLRTAPLIVSGDPFVIQHVLSAIVWNATRDPSVKAPGKTGAHTENAKLQDGVVLPKLLAAIDPEFVNVKCVLTDPRTEVERKWNLRKCCQALRKKSAWPPEFDINEGLLFVGDHRAVSSLCDGIIACFPAKFESDAAIRALREALGLV
jgi:hypothetical protein